MLDPERSEAGKSETTTARRGDQSVIAGDFRNSLRHFSLNQKAHPSRECALQNIVSRELPFDLPFACAAVGHPQAVLRDAPGPILDARAVHSKRIGVPERAAALAISSRRSLCGRAMAVPVGEVAGIIRGRSVPSGSGTVVIAVEVSALIPTLSLDLPFACAALRDPQSVLRYAPRAILHARIVHTKRIRIFKGAAALAIRGSRSLPR